MSELTTSFRASKLDVWEIEAAKKLKALFEQADISQKLAGSEWGIGTAGMVSQYVNGKRPLGLQAAIKFSKGLKVSVAEISPTLAAQLPQSSFNSSNEAQKQPLVLVAPTSEAIKFDDVIRLLADAISASPARGSDVLIGALTSLAKDPDKLMHRQVLATIIHAPDQSSQKAA